MLLFRAPLSRKLRNAHRERSHDLACSAKPPADSGIALAARSGSTPATVSAIVPNYNHGRFLKERLASIVEQRLPASEIIILDDASTDDSREVIGRLTTDIAIPVHTAFNDTNSGSVFSQWAKGISLATSDLIWICESDDTCDLGFLEALVPYFEDQSIVLAFGRIDYIEEDGSLRAMAVASPSAHWEAAQVESARTWFQGPFGICNIIPNVGGCVFRRPEIGADLLSELISFKVCGDWYFHTRLAHGRRIAFEPSARAYFRQHSQNTSVAGFKEERYYEEVTRMALTMRRLYGMGPETLYKLLDHVYERYRANFGDAAVRDYRKRHLFSKILRTLPHEGLPPRSGP